MATRTALPLEDMNESTRRSPPNASLRGILPDCLVTVVNFNGSGLKLLNSPIRTRAVGSEYPAISS